MYLATIDRCRCCLPSPKSWSDWSSVNCKILMISQLSDPPSLPPEQFAYRHDHSCEDLLSKNVNDWHVALDAQKVVGVVELDISKAFDCVNHELLLLELQSSGVGGMALDWFCCHLHGWISLVETTPAGEEFVATHGVPQGSALGPLPFSLSIRTLSSVLCRSLLSQYTGDITLYVI